MTERERTTRAAVLAEARAWLGTPFHHGARIQGVGVDCVQLLIAVYHAAGLIPDIQPTHYPPDWHLHRDEERYRLGVVAHGARPLPPGEIPQPGDLVLYRFGRADSHGAIVLAWPSIISADMQEGCVTIVDGTQGRYAGRLSSSYTLWPPTGTEEAA